MVIEEKDLAGLGGWECFKEAKTYVAAGSVLKSSSSLLKDPDGPILFTGHVIEGRKKYVCGLKFRTLEDVDNLCRCRRAIKEGRICSHSLAVVLHSIQGKGKIDVNKPQATVDEEHIDTFTENYLLPVIDCEMVNLNTIESFLIKFERSSSDKCPTINQLSELQEVLGNVHITKELEINCNRSELGRILKCLRGFSVGFESNFSEESRPCVISETNARIPLTVQRFRGDDSLVELSRGSMIGHYFLRLGSTLWVLNSEIDVLMPIHSKDSSNDVLDELNEILEDANQESSILVSEDWLRCNSSIINGLFHMECSDGLIKSLRLLPANPKLKLSVEGSLKNIEVRADFIYEKGDIVNDFLENTQLHSLRGHGAKSFARIETLKQTSSEIINSYRWAISGEDNVFSFYAGELDEVMRAGKVEVVLGDRFYRVTKGIEKVRPRIKVEEDSAGYFDFELEFISAEGSKLPENEVKRLLSQGKSSKKVNGGEFLTLNKRGISELFTGFEVSVIEQSVTKGVVKRKVEAVESFYIKGLLHDLADYSGFDGHKDLKPSKFGFSAKLKDYQSRGVSWMNARLSEGCGIILADEMGLGKTIQTLALICSANWLKGPTLIICPTSLIDNWSREIQRFTNECKILILHGKNRAENFSKVTLSDIIITSYATVVNDSKLYEELNFSLIVADESSYIKNPDTKTFSALSVLNSYAFMALSGTPLENKLLDLWSVMELVNPSYLGCKKDFIHRYSENISESDRLNFKRRISPFILRRTKEAVLDDLPAKSEKIIHCGLTSKQRSTYEGILRTGKEQLVKFNSAQVDQASRMEILTLLLRLRQVSCDSNLVKLGLEEIEKDSSGKIGPMMSILNSSIGSGGKVLIFSQIVGMLKIIEEQLKENDIGYYYLDGSTSRKQRDSQVQSFQNDCSGHSVFLISLKAGGYGLNLTAADTVIHFDPWWNPSVENQATDRAHRIGQTKPVHSYKLIAAGTVEEKILKLQERKKGLISVAMNDCEPRMSGLSDDDIKTILS
ncbi:MAG: SNF2-related protein [Verrucomicrobiales bacterium]|nr:SNF2-related protein [Verrucomicrobiales bacterium]